MTDESSGIDLTALRSMTDGVWALARESSDNLTAMAGQAMALMADAERRYNEIMAIIDKLASSPVAAHRAMAGELLNHANMHLAKTILELGRSVEADTAAQQQRGVAGQRSGEARRRASEPRLEHLKRLVTESLNSPSTKTVTDIMAHVTDQWLTGGGAKFEEYGQTRLRELVKEIIGKTGHSLTERRSAVR